MVTRDSSERLAMRQFVWCGLIAARSSGQGGAGRPAYDPHLLISLWIYAYSRGIGSAREVERRCAYDIEMHLAAARRQVDAMGASNDEKSVTARQR